MLIKVVCYIKDYTDPQDTLRDDICIESIMDDYVPLSFMNPKKVMISINRNSYIVNAEDMIAAIENCINKNG